MFQQLLKQVKEDSLALARKVESVIAKVHNLFAMMDLSASLKKYVNAKVVLWALILEKV